jgi:hypothetical protein
MELGYAYAYKMLAKPALIIIGIYTDPVDALGHHALPCM